jgi:hypothetical protein
MCDSDVTCHGGLILFDNHIGHHKLLEHVHPLSRTPAAKGLATAVARPASVLNDTSTLYQFFVFLVAPNIWDSICILTKVNSAWRGGLLIAVPPDNIAKDICFRNF